MTDANEVHRSIMRELNNLCNCDTDETDEEQVRFSFQELTDADYIPPSLLSYFETSKNRAAVCEKLLLEESEDFTASHHTEDMINLDMMKVNEQVIETETEDEEDNSSIDARLLSASTETEVLLTHRVPVCLNDEGEVGTNNCMESAKHLTFETRTLEVSLNEEGRKKSTELEAEREKQHCEEMKREERKRQIERDFQKELRKIIEADKLHQEELELIAKRAQEKLEQEFRLQQELISNLQKRVEEERRMREEEQKRRKDEEDQRKREEEKNKMEAERKRMEEKTKRKKEEERKAEEVKLEEEKKRKIEREKERKREDENYKIDLEKNELEDEMRLMKEEEGRKRKERERTMREQEEKVKREMERKKIEEATMEMKKEKRINEEEMSYKKEEERKKTEEENTKKEEVERVTKETEEGKKQEELRKRKKEEDADGRKKVTQEKMYEEMRKRDKRAHGNVDEGIKLTERKREDEEEEASYKGKESKNMEDKVKEVVKKQEEENRKKMKEELRPIEEHDKRKKEDGRKTKEEELKRMQKEEMRRQRNEEVNRKSEEERWEKEKRKMEKEGKEQNGREVRENNKGFNKKVEEEMRVKEKEERESRVEQDEEMGVIVVRANEMQEKKELRENSMIGQKEKPKTDKTDNSSQIEDPTTWISSSSVPLHSEPAICPMRTEAVPQHYDLDENISQTSTDKTADRQKNQAARPSTEFLPEHTEQKRLSWMKDCISWSKLSLQNRRKQKGSVWSRRAPRRPAEADGLPPLCPDSLLQTTAWKSLQEVTSVTLEDLPGCSLSTLAQCSQLQLLSLRRCGLRSLEGINQLPQLYFIDVQENDISFVNCENMSSLRVLRLSHNKLTSIHGLTGAENLDVLDISHNSISRIAGLESVRRLQRLSVAHNQLISTKGLKDVYTLLHLNCSHNHLASVEGLENSALLNTLDLRANSLTEPPSLNNQVLLRELYLDDNSISSLQSLSTCWLPLMQHLSVAQNRITQLPSMSDSVSLTNLDLRFNCVSELQNVCKSLEGCQSLRELHLTGNPLQQDSGWRSTLQKAVPGLRAIDNQETNSSLLPPAVQQVSSASGSFLTFCQAQLQQTRDLQQQHSRELSEASSSLDAVKTSCRHFTEALQLATEQRFAHEYGDTTVADKHITADQIIPEETLDMDSTNTEKHTDFPEMEFTGKGPPVFSNRDNIRCSYWTSEEKSAGENRHDTVTAGPKTGPTVSKANFGSVHSSETKRKTISSNLEMAPVFSHQNLDLQNTAAVVIQQLWRKYRQKCGNISSPSTAEKGGRGGGVGGGGGGGGGGGDGGKPESGPSDINGSVVGQDYAATVIQALWRGFSLRKRLASALAAVTSLDTGEDDTFEEVDMDEFAFDEAVLEKPWIVPLPEDLPPIRYPMSEQPLFVKPPGPFPEPPQNLLQPPPAWRSKQAWVAEEQVDSARQRVSPVSPNRSKYPASASVIAGLSDRSEKILEEWGFTNHHTALLMLKRAQNMKSKKQQQSKRREPSVRLAFIRNYSYQLGPVEAGNRQAQHNRDDIKVCEAEQAERTERVKQDRAQQWLHTRAAHSDRDSESGHFLPEISSGILNGGRVQLVADSGYTERLHHASGLWANSRSAAQLCKENNYPHRNSLGHAMSQLCRHLELGQYLRCVPGPPYLLQSPPCCLAPCVGRPWRPQAWALHVECIMPGDEVPPPKRVTSAPSKKERISFRDNHVQLSGGWGGGKKRDKVYK